MYTKLLGPIVSTNDIDAWRSLLTGGFNLNEVCAESLSEQAVQSLWGLSGHRAETALFETDGTPFGIRVIRLLPGAEETVRHRCSGHDCNALKVIDFYAPSFEEARSRLKRVGYDVKEEIAEYDVGSVRITEAHLWGPDEVVCAILSGTPEFFGDFVSITNALFSEVLSISAPVDCPADAIQFYARLGLEDVYQYEVTDSSFQHLVGSNGPIHVRAVNMGSRRDQPYFGIIHYGLPADTQNSLADRAWLPNRGLIGATVRVSDLAVARQASIDDGYEIIADARPVRLKPYGLIRSMVIRAPHGVHHQLIEIDGNPGSQGYSQPETAG